MQNGIDNCLLSRTVQRIRQALYLFLPELPVGAGCVSSQRFLDGIKNNSHGGAEDTELDLILLLTVKLPCGLTF